MNYMNYIGHKLEEPLRILGEFQLFLRGIPHSIRNEENEFIRPSHFRIQLERTVGVDGYDLDVIIVRKSNESIFEDGRWIPFSIRINVTNYYNPFGNPDQVEEREQNFHFSYMKGYEWFAEKVLDHFDCKSYYKKDASEEERKIVYRALHPEE